MDLQMNFLEESPEEIKEAPPEGLLEESREECLEESL